MDQNHNNSTGNSTYDIGVMFASIMLYTFTKLSEFKEILDVVFIIISIIGASYAGLNQMRIYYKKTKSKKDELK